MDFSNYPRIFTQLNGAAKKILVRDTNSNWILKFDNELQKGVYSRASVSEYITHLLCYYLEIPCQTVRLGTYYDKPVCALEYFLKDGETLHHYMDIDNNSFGGLLSSDISFTDAPYTLDEILTALIWHENLHLDVQYRVEYFLIMIMIDTIIGNFDRHHGNWGFIGSNGQYTEMAPLFDNGSSLFPMLNGDNLYNVLYSEEELLKRVYKFPTSQIKTLGRKTPYLELIKQTYKYGMLNILDYYEPYLNNDLLCNIFSDNMLNEHITKIEKEFLHTIMKLRMEKLLLEPYHFVRGSFNVLRLH